uniref:Uncharacterized protein n=1 Tax=Panagrolaimus sp. PS1159 TaxID=55785 RepID=A0AC35G6F0_9BILA
MRRLVLVSQRQDKDRQTNNRQATKKLLLLTKFSISTCFIKILKVWCGFFREQFLDTLLCIFYLIFSIFKMKNFFFNYYVFDYTFKNAFILYANLFLVDRVLFPSGITKIFFLNL